MAAAAQGAAVDWHRRMGHLSYSNLARMAESGMVQGLPVSASAFREAGQETCDVCQRTKQTALPFEPAVSTTSAPLELVHSDLCGPLPVAASGGERYILTLLDDHTGLALVQLLRFKHQAAAAVKDMVALLERQTSHQLKRF